MDEAQVVKTNDGVLDYLRYYIDPKHEFDFAVLLSGAWGSGKTHLLKNFLKSASVKPLYVSLYGMTTTAQIEEEFYRQLHPFLASKGMKIFGAIARSAIKGTLKIDLNGDGKDDGVWNANIPEIDLTKELGNPKECLLVFDDLERCKMSTTEVLGYINSFVEHDDLKAIIVANEDEIIRNVDSRYRDLKEKLIGQTLTMAAPADAAFDAFLRAIRDEKTSEFLAEHKSDVLALHSAGGFNNLRMLKQALWDFERISRHFEDRHWANDGAMVKLLNVVISLSLEHRGGRLGDGQISKLIGDQFARIFQSHASGEESKEAKIETRYPQVDFDDAILDATLLEGSLVRGESDGEAIRAALDGSADFAAPEHQLLWQRAWNAFTDDDDTAADVVRELELAFENREFKAGGELMQVFGIRLWFSTVGLLSKSREGIVAECKRYIDDLSEQSRLPSSLDQDQRLDHGPSYASKGIMEAASPEFQEIAVYYSEAAERNSQSQYLHVALRLIEKLEESPHDFLLDLVLNGIRKSPYYDVPVLAALPPAFIAQLIFEGESALQMRMLEMLHGRHERNSEALKIEKPWLIDVHRELVKRLPDARPMNQYRLKSLIARNLEPVLPDSKSTDQTR